MLCECWLNRPPPQLTRAQRRRTRNQFAVGLALLVLGAGNIAYGRIKHAGYRELLSEAASELTSTEKTRGPSIFSPTVSIDKHAQYVQKLQSHLDFYRFVMLGGGCFCAAGMLFGALAFLSTRPKSED